MSKVSHQLSYESMKVVVAGGGGDGMGAAAARLVAELGGEVIVLDLREPAHGDLAFRPTDLGSSEEIDEAVADIDGPVHALFNCQGISGARPGTTVADVMKVNFLGVRHLTEALLPRMPAGSAVASISSAGGLGWQRRAGAILAMLDQPDLDSALAWCAGAGQELVPQAFPHAYALSKQALILWTMQRAATSIKAGVRMNVTSPGSTATSMAPDFPVAGVDGMNSPSNRSSSPLEQAWPIVFLNSPQASYVNGVNVPVDGGNYAERVVGREVAAATASA